ncbi:hypothetical protein HPB50_012995 [Hyalomma asiaticum]|uniref:Uncharacterized protein n=1 Tax=Hyalomma asiaticum TaxID=266040 RepID=A0ACB7S6U5_HYAAI|nr:hypothetical protein HPB50_012995 [Hyalomma asiaticum]
MLPVAGAVPSGPHPVQVPEIRSDQHLQMPASASCGTSSGTGMPPGAVINHSSKSPAESSLLPAQVSPSKRISCLDVSLPDGQDDFSDMSDSSATITYMDATANSSDDSEKRSVIPPPKRCRGSKRLHLPLNSVPAEHVPKSNLTVIFKPRNPEHVVTRFNPLRLKAAFEAVAPDGVLQVRPNERLNLLAVDTRSVEASERLLKVTNIGEIALQAYEPRPNNCGVGVIKGVPVDLDQQDIFSALLQRAPVKSVRRLGTSENVRIVFATETAPEYIVLGYTRYRVFKYIECPRQCSKCQRFGHVAGACRLPVRCPRCGGNHDRSSCATEQLQCPNCKKQHESTSSRCRVLRKEKEIHNYKMNHNVGYISAKAAIYEKRKAASRGSNDGTTVSCKDACKTAPENPPRIEDTEEFPSLPTRNLPLSPCVTAAKESTQGSGVRVQESTTAAGSSERRGPQFVSKHRFPVIAISESRVRTGIRLSGYTITYSSTGGDTSRVLLAIRNDLIFNIHAVPPDASNEYAAATVKWNSLTFTVIAAYIPPGVKFDVKKLQAILDTTPEPHVLTGDFNAHHPAWGGAKNNNFKKPHNENIPLPSSDEQPVMLMGTRHHHLPHRGSG